MNQLEKEAINKLLADRPDLICEQLYTRSLKKVQKIISMPAWKDPKFQGLLTSTIWNNSNAEEAKKILSMPAWKDPKYAELLTPGIWQSSAEEVQKIISMPEWEDARFAGLLTSNIWKSNAEEVKKILSMPEWEDARFADLLTSNIWKSNAKEVEEKLHLKYWNDSRYEHLLRPSIFANSISNIHRGIELLEQYGISQYITNRSLRRNQEQQKELLEYMVNNKIDLVVENMDGTKRLNPMLNASNTVLRKQYHIDVKSLVQKKKEEFERDE